MMVVLVVTLLAALSPSNAESSSSTIVYSNEEILGLLRSCDHERSLLAAVALLGFIGYVFYLFAAMSWAAVCSTSSPTFQISRRQAFTTIFLFVLGMEHPWMLFLPNDNNDGLAFLIQGTDRRLNKILERVPLLRRGPSPPFWLQNRHIQFIPWLVQNEIHRVAQAIPFQRLQVPVTDCVNKVPDCLQYPKNLQMNDTVTLDIFPSLDSDVSHPGFNNSSPVIFFSPGLRCYSQDMPGNSVIRKAYAAGFRSIVVNRRGHTPLQKLQSPRWNLFGDVDDLEQVYWFVKETLVAPGTPMFLHGISSGTAVTVTALTKWDMRRQEGLRSPSFVASMSIAPGYDVSKVLHPERFLFPYNTLLLGGVKDHFVRQNEALLRAFNSTAVDEVLAANNLQEFVDAAVPFTGYNSTSHYYQDSNPINDMRGITTPKLVLNAVDDPCCNIRNLLERSPYPEHEGETFASIIAKTQNGLVAVTKTGSHCPFLSASPGGLWVRDPLMKKGWMLNSWGDQVSIEFYQAALEVYPERRFL